MAMAKKGNKWKCQYKGCTGNLTLTSEGHRLGPSRCDACPVVSFQHLNNATLVKHMHIIEDFKEEHLERMMYKSEQADAAKDRAQKAKLVQLSLVAATKKALYIKRVDAEHRARLLDRNKMADYFAECASVLSCEKTNARDPARDRHNVLNALLSIKIHAQMPALLRSKLLRVIKKMARPKSTSRDTSLVFLASKLRDAWKPDTHAFLTKWNHAHGLPPLPPLRLQP